jgi:hypothetical protein
VGPVSHKFSKLTAHPWKNRWVIEQVFRHHQYAFDQWAATAEILARVARRAAQGKKPLIIDAGANIGAVTVYFALKMPSARIVAIEPAADNFAVLERNTAGLDAELRSVLPAASGPSTWGLGAWGYRTERAQHGAGSAPVLSINQLYSTHAGEACRSSGRSTSRATRGACSRRRPSGCEVRLLSSSWSRMTGCCRSRTPCEIFGADGQPGARHSGSA